MKEKDYVRYKYENIEYIGRIKFISEVMLGLDETLLIDIDNCMEGTLKKDIIKSSPNIIDLIEVGDYVNGSYIYSVVEENKNTGQPRVLFTEEDGVLGDGDIKSIVTKEQFKDMEYRT